MRTRLLGWVTVVALAASACGGGAPSAASGPSEGIAVHGDWTIEVYEPDGSLDERIEFENALVEDGEEALASILARAETPQYWRIAYGYDETSWPERVGPCGSNYCWLTEPGNGWAGAGVSETLSVDVVDRAVVLRGSATAIVDGWIGQVGTRLEVCNAGGCGVERAMTFRMVGDENGAVFRIDTGQTIQVEVVISFTTG